jgi:hypothetical protein
MLPLRPAVTALAIASSFAFALSLVGCQSVPPVPMGVQPEFAAVNPSRVLAVPPFVLPDPGRPTEIDPTIVESENTRRVIENAVLGAFKNQPGVNGVSFQAVSRVLGESPNARTRMEEVLKATAARLTSTREGERSSLPRECLARRNFLDFYVHCLATEKIWVDELNALSSLILNADTALLTVVTELRKGESPSDPDLAGGVAVLIVDTNSGKLIWGRQSSEAIASDGRKPAEVSDLFTRLLSETFWESFPGRRQATERPDAGNATTLRAGEPRGIGGVVNP